MPGSKEYLTAQDSPTQMDCLLQETCLAHKQVIAAYIFGSQATGEAGPRSDLDGAALLHEDRQQDFLHLHAIYMQGMKKALKESSHGNNRSRF